MTLVGCGTSSPPTEHSQSTTIRVVFPTQQASVWDQDLPDATTTSPASLPARVLRQAGSLTRFLEAREVSAQVLPSSIAALLLRVIDASGTPFPGLAQVNIPLSTSNNGTVIGSVTVDVPIGLARVFSVKAFLNCPGGVREHNFVGQTQADVPSGGTTVTITMTPTDEVVVASPSDQSSTPGQVITVALRASASHCTPLTFSASNLPPGLDIDPHTGVISGMPSAGGTYPVTITISDGTHSTTVTLTVAVNLCEGVVCNQHVCATGTCDQQTGQCAYTPVAGAVCRASRGECDVAEVCDGSTNDCPADAFLPATTVCRAAAGVCDVAETCTGTSAACPADAKQPNTFVCRASAGVCDVAETCTGSTNDCPADAFLPASTVCRPATDVCDITENCTGSSASCPADAKAPAGTTCNDGIATTSCDACDGQGTCLGVVLTLTVRKHVVNDDGGAKLAKDFELLLAVNNSMSPTHLVGSETGTTFPLVDGDTYRVTEDLTLQPGGDYSQLYTATIPSADCDSSVTCSPLSARNKICTVTNDDKSLPSGLCQPSSALSVLVTGTNVVAYVAKGNWGGGVTNVAVVNIEGSSIIPQQIPTPNVVNACASNSLTGQTVCTANNTDVYVISSTTINTTLTSSGSGSISFLLPDGACTNCGVAMDATHNKAVIALSLQDGLGGYQYLNLGASPILEPAFPSQGPFNDISEGMLIDPIRNLILSPDESGNFEIVNVATTTSPAFFENVAVPLGPNDIVESAGEDCTTGVALALAHTSTGGPSKVYIADLTQATFTPGSPGMWSAPSQVQTLLESILPGGASGLAVAQGTHTGIVTGESGVATITAIALPTTSGSGTPTISDWVTCSVPGGFSTGEDPHAVTAYQSPNGGHAIGLVANADATTLAVVDLTMMLNPTIVPRTGGGHACAAGTLPATVVSTITVPSFPIPSAVTDVSP